MILVIGSFSYSPFHSIIIPSIILAPEYLFDTKKKSIIQMKLPQRRLGKTATCFSVDYS